MSAQSVRHNARVARCALQNAASVAGLLLTTEAMVTEATRQEERGCRSPPMHDMGDM